MTRASRSAAIQPAEYHVCPQTGIEFASVPAGAFYAGPRTGSRVVTPAFSMARHPVTNAQWHHFSKDTKYSPHESLSDTERYLKHWMGSEEPPEELANHPVTWISFIDALHYTSWSGFSIPSEWHWEKAARGLDGRKCPWGDDVESGLLWAQVQQKKTAAVDAFAHVRTAFGCEQMIGNVAEFCLRADTPVGETLPQSPASKVRTDEVIVLRGSCFLRASARAMECSHRRNLSARRRNSWTGLRVAGHLD